MMVLHPEKLIINWDYEKPKIHLILLAEQALLISNMADYRWWPHGGVADWQLWLPAAGLITQNSIIAHVHCLGKDKNPKCDFYRPLTTAIPQKSEKQQTNRKSNYYKSGTVLYPRINFNKNGTTISCFVCVCYACICWSDKEER